MRSKISKIITSIKPYDNLEQEYINDSLGWLNSSADIFRISKPDNPPKHLVSYFVLYDDKSNKLMLIDHIKSGLWLPAGGHVDIDEHPRTTVIREAKEELGIDADFNTKFSDKPFFITITKTIGQGFHTDVSLWYVIKGDRNRVLDYEKREMNGYKWYTPEEILAIDISKLDPQMHRFTNKMFKTI